MNPCTDFFQILTVYTFISKLLIYVCKHRKKLHFVIFFTCLTDLCFFVVLDIVNFDGSFRLHPKLTESIFIIFYMSPLYKWRENCVFLGLSNFFRLLKVFTFNFFLEIFELFYRKNRRISNSNRSL